MRNVLKRAMCLFAIAGAMSAFGETAKSGSCMSKAITLKSSQAVTLVNEYDPDFKEFYDSGVCYYKVSLRKGQAYTIWISGGAAADLNLSVDVDWRLESAPFAIFDYVEYPNGVKAAYMYSDAWDEDDPSSFTYYVSITGEIGQKTTLGYTTGIASFSQPGEEGNPKRITPADSQKNESTSLIDYGYYFVARLEAGRKYMFRTTGGSASAKLTMDIDPMGDYAQEAIPSYSNDLNNTSWYVYPGVTQDYVIYVQGDVRGSGSATQNFKLKYMSFPSRLPGQHSSTELKSSNNYTVSNVSPGRKVRDVAYYDNVIDEALFRIKLPANEKWAFETSGAISNIQMVVYDSQGNEMRSNTSKGDGTKDCRAVILTTAADWYYVGVCRPDLGYWDASPTDRSVTVRAYPTKDIEPPDSFDPADDSDVGAELIDAFPASASASVAEVGSTSGAHKFNANDWYDWFCFAGRSGVTYALKATLASNTPISLKLATKVYKMVNGSRVKVSDTIGSISPDGTDEALKALTFTADANSMYYVRVSVADGLGLDYPEYKVHAIAYMSDGKTNLGLVQGKTKGANSTWYFTDDATGLYLNGAKVAIPVGVVRKVRFSPVSGYATPAKTSVTPVAWGGEAADIKVVTGIYNDTYDPADNNESNFVSITPTSKDTKAKRTLWAEDPGDWFRFKVEKGCFYNFWLTDVTEDGVGDAVFLIKYYTDTTNIVQGVTEYRKKTFPVREKGKYNLRVYHRQAPRQDTVYRLHYQAINVGMVKFASTTPKVSESADYVDVVVQRTASTGAVRVNFATEAYTAKPGKEYYPTNGVIAWADGDMSDKTIRVRLIPDLVEEWDAQLRFKIRLWPMSEDVLAENEYPASIEADTATVKIKEITAQNPGTIKVTDGATPVVAGNKISLKISRTGGSNGKVAVKVKTQPGTALADRDYVHVNKILVWNDGDSAPKVFEITTKDSRQAQDLAFNIKMTVQNTGSYAGYATPTIAEKKTYLTITPAYAAGAVVLASPLSRSVAPGDTLKAVFSRVGSSKGRIAVKVKTQDASTVNGMTAYFVKDFAYNNKVIVWENGDSSDKIFEVPTVAVSGYGDSKTFRLKLSVKTTGDYANCQTPDIPEAKIVMTISNRNAPAGTGVATVVSGYDAYGKAVSAGGTNELAQGVRTSISLGMGGGQKAASCTLLAGALPPGLKYDASRFVISGAPTAAGYYSALFQARNDNAAGAGLWLDFHVSEIGTAAGSFIAAVKEDGEALATGYPRIGRITALTVGQNGTIAATVKIAGTKYKFSAGSFNSLAEDEEVGSATKTYLSTITSIATINSGIYTNKMEMAIVSGDLEDGAVLGDVAGTVKMTLNVLSGGEVREVVYKGELVRDNTANEDWLAAAAKYAGYYTVSLVPNGVVPSDGVPCGNGYLTLTLDETGTAKYAGLLADGTAVSGSSRIALQGGLVEAGTALIPIGIYASPWSFGGVLKLDWSEDVASGFVTTAVDSRSALEWNKDGATSSYDGQGFSIEIRPTGGWYNTLVNLQTYYLDRDFYVQAQSVYGFPGRMLPSGYTYTADTMPHDVNVTLNRSSLVPDTRVLVKKDGSTLYDLAQSVNPWKVKTSFVPETGLLTGTFKPWSDGKTQVQIATVNHYGVLLMNRDANTPLDEDVWTAGFFLLPVNKNWTFSLPFNIRAVKVDRDWSEAEVPVVQ